jgi:xanthine dehydrogenase iron-sulfur cluster and FAD-binding subunit A
VHPLQERHRSIENYDIVDSIEAAWELLAEHGERARLIAGGSDLLLELERGGRADVRHLIDVSRIPGASDIVISDDVITLGFATTHAQVIGSEVLVEHSLPLAQACAEVGSPQLRNRATVVGNLVTASPANDTISALMALDAELVVSSLGSTRTISVGDLYTGFRTTVLRPDEMVTQVSIPRARAGSDRRGMFSKLGLRSAQSISVVHLGLVVDFDDPQDDQIVTWARVALGSLAATVIRAEAVEAGLIGRRLDEASIAAAVATVQAMIEPISDVRATAEYRQDVTGTVLARTLRALASGRHRERWRADTPRLVVTKPERSGAEATESGALPTSFGEHGGLTVSVNGTPISAPTRASDTLLDWLREDAHMATDAGLTGTKEGCAEGECGACTVMMDGVAVLSCLVPSMGAAGAEVTTVEGLESDGRLHAVQEAFIECGAVQCGFCTPGFLVSAAALLEECPQPSQQQVSAGLAGNLCRCTGYFSIVNAVVRAAGATS